MDTNIKKWLNKEGIILLREIGIREGQTVLDCCCGSGTYTIPAGKIVGEKGKVYALDKDVYKLEELEKRVKLDGLGNIEIKKTGGELNFGFGDDTFDVVLLYDIFWYFPLINPNLLELLKEIRRVSKPNALISVYPEHIDIDGLRRKIERIGFYIENKFRGEVIHESRFEKGQILNFRREV